jgi:transposase
MAYSIDFIKTAVAYKQKGHTFKQLEEAFGIPSQTYYLWKKKLENGFYQMPKTRQERRRKIDKEKLKQAVKEKPDAYLHELATLFGCSFQAVFTALKNLGITLKKRPSPISKNQRKNVLNTNAK